MPTDRREGRRRVGESLAPSGRAPGPRTASPRSAKLHPADRVRAAVDLAAATVEHVPHVCEVHMDAERLQRPPYGLLEYVTPVNLRAVRVGSDHVSVADEAVPLRKSAGSPMKWQSSIPSP